MPPLLKRRIVFAFSNVAVQSLAKLCGKTLRLLPNSLYASVAVTSIGLSVVVGMRDLVCMDAWMPYALPWGQHGHHGVTKSLFLPCIKEAIRRLIGWEGQRPRNTEP